VAETKLRMLPPSVAEEYPYLVEVVVELGKSGYSYGGRVRGRAGSALGRHRTPPAGVNVGGQLTVAYMAGRVACRCGRGRRPARA
jgi:hypothetical protein